MKILIVHQHFKTPQTGGAIRSYFLAKALVERGHTTVVITAHNERGYKHAAVEGIDVHYLPVAYDNRFGFYARGWSFLKFMFQAARLTAKLEAIDLCYAISVPLTTGLVARWIKFRHGIPYLFEVGDLWPDAPIQMGLISNPILKGILYRVERDCYRHAEAIVALSPEIQSVIQQKAHGKRVHMVPNMSDCDFFHPAPRADRKFVVSYIGAIGFANGLDFFLECANASRKAGLPVHFILQGEGALKERLKVSAQQLGLQNLTFRDFTNRAGVKDTMEISDAIFVCYRRVQILQTGSPNKFFDGLAAGKLIVINFSGWIRREIEENRCGVFVDPGHPPDFLEKIKPFVTDAKPLKAYQEASRSLAERKYSRAKLGETWMGIIETR